MYECELQVSGINYSYIIFWVQYLKGYLTFDILRVITVINPAKILRIRTFVFLSRPPASIVYTITR